MKYSLKKKLDKIEAICNKLEEIEKQVNYHEERDEAVSINVILSIIDVTLKSFGEVLECYDDVSYFIQYLDKDYVYRYLSYVDMVKKEGEKLIYELTDIQEKIYDKNYIFSCLKWLSKAFNLFKTRFQIIKFLTKCESLFESINCDDKNYLLTLIDDLDS